MTARPTDELAKSVAGEFFTTADNPTDEAEFASFMAHLVLLADAKRNVLVSSVESMAASLRKAGM